MRRKIAIGLIVGAVLASGAGVAVAGVSDGNYDPARQGCSGNANDTERADTAEEGCQNFTVNVRDGSDNEAARVGLPQLKDGDSPNPTNATYEASPEAFDPATGAHFYMGADDNLNSGEHDGSDQVGDGPSDGGAIVLNIDPNSIERWVGALMTGDSQYLLTHPAPLFDAGIGACTDGLCNSTQTQRRRAYDGGSQTAPDRDAANYDGYTWDPQGCSGADSGDAPEQCGPGGLAYWHSQSGDVYVNPGVQVYEDPNPAGSPIGPYPIPGVYAGTCGVVYSPTDGPAVVVPTGC
jgi:hypothetical protein